MKVFNNGTYSHQNHLRAFTIMKRGEHEWQRTMYEAKAIYLLMSSCVASESRRLVCVSHMRKRLKMLRHHNSGDLTIEIELYTNLWKSVSICHVCTPALPWQILKNINHLNNRLPCRNWNWLSVRGVTWLAPGEREKQIHRPAWGWERADALQMRGGSSTNALAYSWVMSSRPAIINHQLMKIINLNK